MAALLTPEPREATERRLLPMAEKAVVSPGARAARAESVHLTAAREAMADGVFCRRMGHREEASAGESATRLVRAESVMAGVAQGAQAVTVVRPEADAESWARQVFSTH